MQPDSGAGKKGRRVNCGAKLLFGLIAQAIIASHTVAMLRWSEARGVYDDVCYLRQAHFFQRFGLLGLNTDAVMDDHRYFFGKLKEIALAAPDKVERWPCHVEKTGGKVILQYPPGTGFLLALFPQGFQVAPLYSTSIIVFGFGLLGLHMARTLTYVTAAGFFGARSQSMYDRSGGGELFGSVHLGRLQHCGLLDGAVVEQA